MKKKIVIILLALVFALTLFSGCAYNYSENPVSIKNFSAEQIEKELFDFLTAHPNRSSFSNEEKTAAEYLRQRLENIGAETQLQEFPHRYVYEESYPSSVTIDYSFGSQNVIGLIAGKNNTGGEKIVVGCMYDNLYSYADFYEAYCYVNNSMYKGHSGRTDAEGALSATGAAVSLSLAEKIYEYNESVGLTFDVEFVFFGAEEFGCLGSDAYASSSRINNVSLFINLSRIGGDNIYAYFDEVNTSHGEVFMDNADSLGYGKIITQPGGNQTIIGATSTGKLPYTNFSLIGSSGAFFGEGIRVANFTTGVFDSIFYTYKESLLYQNIFETANDTYKKLSQVCPKYNIQCAVVADTVFESLIDGSLPASLTVPPYDYTWLTFPIAGYVSVIVLCLLCAVLMIILIKYFEKKYPPVSKTPKKVKIAVFGMDYENPKDADIFIDTKYTNTRQKQKCDPFGDNSGNDKPDGN